MGVSVEARSVGFSYPGAKRVFSDVSLALRPGEVVCLLGANGCGKTTLLRCIAGLLAVEAGTVLVDGSDIASFSRRQIARLIGYVPQHSHQSGLSYPSLDVVSMGRAPHLAFLATPGERDLALAQDALARVGATDLSHQPFSRLSGGEQQLVVLARLLCQQTAVALLDEPAAHLDLRNQSRLMRLTRELADAGLSILMTSHAPDHAFDVADRVALLHDGRLLACGPTQDVLTSENLSQAYATDLRVIAARDPEEGGFVRVVRAVKPGLRNPGPSGPRQQPR